MAGQPVISWFEGTAALSSEVTGLVNYGTVDADTDSSQKTFWIVNNRDGDEDVSKMEEVTFTTRDRLGGTGDTPGNEVQSVRDNWFQVRVDSLNESAFTPVGKGGVGAVNPSGTKEVGTNGSTTNPNAATASTWASGVAYVVGDYIKPTVANQFIYKVTKDGTTGGTQPTWALTAGGVTTDGTVEYVAVRITVTPGAQEILGLANNVQADGSDILNAGGNFAKITVYAEVPVSANAGKNQLLQRISFRYV